MCAGQSQDGKGVSSGSGFELSELMKRRLESVASTGSSASSGFIEDKSYCDSEEEEEGKGQARLASFQRPPAPVCPSCCLPPHLCSTPPAQERQLPSDCFLVWWDISSSCSAAQSLQQEPLSPHWVWRGDCLFPVLTWLLLCFWASAQARHISHVECCCVISGLISCLLRWASGRTPCKFLSVSTFHLTSEKWEEL